jgi:hypothetical protein
MEKFSDSLENKCKLTIKEHIDAIFEENYYEYGIVAES